MNSSHNISILNQTTPYEGNKNPFDQTMLWKEIVRKESQSYGRNISKSQSSVSSLPMTPTRSSLKVSEFSPNRRQNNTNFTFPQEQYKSHIKVTEIGRQQSQGSLSLSPSSTNSTSFLSHISIENENSFPKTSSNKDYGKNVQSAISPISKPFNKTKKFGDQFYKQPTTYGFV